MSGNKIARIGALMASAAIFGRMTPMERQKGRYMRAPDGHGDGGGGDSGDAEFDAFEKAGAVEVGSTKDAAKAEKPAAKPDAKAGAAKLAAAAAEKVKGADTPAKGEGEEEEGAGDGEGEGEGEEEEEEEEEQPKPKKKASERIRELNAR